MSSVLLIDGQGAPARRARPGRWPGAAAPYPCAVQRIRPSRSSSDQAVCRLPWPILSLVRLLHSARDPASGCATMMTHRKVHRFDELGNVAPASTSSSGGADLAIEQPSHVRCADINYIRMQSALLAGRRPRSEFLEDREAQPLSRVPACFALQTITCWPCQVRSICRSKRSMIVASAESMALSRSATRGDQGHGGSTRLHVGRSRPRGSSSSRGYFRQGRACDIGASRMMRGSGVVHRCGGRVAVEQCAARASDWQSPWEAG